MHNLNRPKGLLPAFENEIVAVPFRMTPGYKRCRFCEATKEAPVQPGLPTSRKTTVKPSPMPPPENWTGVGTRLMMYVGSRITSGGGGACGGPGGGGGGGG